MTPSQITYRINMIAVLEDLQHQYMKELSSDLKQGLKMMLNDSIKATGRFIKECDRVHGQRAEHFGNAADLLRELIDKEFNK